MVKGVPQLWQKFGGAGAQPNSERAVPHLARNLSVSAMDAPRFAQANGSFSYHRFFVVNFLDAAIVEVHFGFVVSDLHDFQALRAPCRE